MRSFLYDTEEFQALSSPRKYVEWWVQEKKVKISPDGELTDEFRTKGDIMDSLWLDYLEQVQAHKANRLKLATFSLKALHAATNEFISLEVTRLRKETIKRLEFQGENEDLFNQWITALIGKDGKDYELTKAVLKHWIWSIKRKLIGKEVTDHIMPVLYGGQGGGKSTAINKLISVLEEYSLRWSFDQLGDDRNNKNFSLNYICVLD